MRSNKISNSDLFTSTANENYRKHIKTQSKKVLEILKQTIDWKTLISSIENELNKNKSTSNVGRKPISMLVIVRCFLLQYIYDLSDPRLEEEIADRRSFQMFLELNSGDSIPDETTICRYREMFSRLGLDKLLFDTFNKQLRKENMILERATLIDATIKQAQSRPGVKRDSDARFTKKNNKSYYGYKGHIGLDLGSDIIHSLEFTPANVHDSNVFEALMHWKEKSSYADKAYMKEARDKMLAERGIDSCILQRGKRGNPLTGEQKSKNKQLSKIRGLVERPFAWMKQILKYDRCRYYDLGRNRFQFTMSALLYNMRRFISLSTA